MIKAPYDSTRKYDIILEKVVKSIRSHLVDTEDDNLWMVVGTTGSGKSMLMLHVMELFLGDEASVDYIGLSREDFADATRAVIARKTMRFLSYDEANITKRDSMTRFNKDIIDWYLSNRGLQIFHWWSNPSLDIIDKQFITERIKGVIFIASKEVNKPRIYYYFTKLQLLQIYEKYSCVKLQI